MSNLQRLASIGLTCILCNESALLRAQNEDSAKKDQAAARAKDVDARVNEGNPIRVKLDKAKAAYEAEAKKQREAMIESFQKKEESAARAGDKKLRDQVRSERERFESKSILPDVIPGSEYRWRMRQANMTMEAAYKAALKDYLVAKKDYDAEAVDKELAEFKKRAPDYSEPEQWVGVSTYKSEPTPVRLIIESVDGANFRGQYHVLFRDGTIKAQERVTGRIEKGAISYKLFTSNNGPLVSFAAVGVISGNRIEGTWESAEGSGKGTLSLVLESKKK